MAITDANYGTGCASYLQNRADVGRIWHSSASPGCEVIPMSQEQTLSIAQAAERLKVRADYVHELVRKGRLTFIGGDRLDEGEVTRLAILMDKLRSKGIATMVQIVEDGGSLDK
jgi:hypothetical protein